ncbi:alpha/beta hydrolase family protein [Albibacterium indicum]|uniref:alpha/beta hydrolase family protein n=1 Tax=Albibacterium indicum TaxID=2292082 RepID=UPI000E536FE4|nr:alpha/beta fold hydrolase [Pedobacter indicus]
MRKILLLLPVLFSILSTNAQTAIHPTVDSFSRYYSANQPDSIYLLFNSNMKEVVKLEGTKLLISQLKEQLGYIVGTREVEAPAPNVREFRISFEKPLVDMALIIQDDSISGIWQRPVERTKDDSTSVQIKDNFSVSNDYGTLYGTLTLPERKGEIPVVLLISGSGPTDRNMNQGQALKTNSFLMLAEALAKQGVASVRYDKRGVGKSSNAMRTSDLVFDDFVDDAILFIEKLKDDQRFSNVIVLGHSEGSVIGSIASTKEQPTAFISLCGPASNILELIGEQLKVNLASENLAIAHEVLDSLKMNKRVNRELPPGLNQLFNPSVQPYLISSNKYNPANVMSELAVPTLIVGGDTDIQVNVSETKRLGESAPKAEYKLIHRMNHVLKEAPADREKNLQTYYDPSLPLHPELVPTLLDFIKKVEKF